MRGSVLDFLAQLPAQLQAIFVEGFHSAFTLAIANSMWLGVAATGLALVATLFLREIPLRQTLGAHEDDMVSEAAIAVEGPNLSAPIPVTESVHRTPMARHTGE